MRGKTPEQPSMLALVSIESMVPADHPLRGIRPLVQRVLHELDPVFERMYTDWGRPSVPPERLLKAMLLMSLYSVRSERQFCEQLGYNMLFRWFLDMDLTERPFDASVFSKNRERLLEHDVARHFFDAILELDELRRHMSSDHFSVDGTLIEAWASAKSFRPKGEEESDNNGFADFKGTQRSNDTHESTTDPESRLFRKGRGREAKLSYMAHVLMENRNGLIQDFELTEANGKAEREAALAMVDRERERRARQRKKTRRKQRKASQRTNQKGRRLTLAADKGYDTRDFVRACRERRITPHVAQNQHVGRSSAIDNRTVHHPGYRVSSRARLLIEKIFGWAKTIGGYRRSRFRGRGRTRAAGLMVMSAFNLLRISKLTIKTT
ncbi:MAG: IS5 family transposase [Myxococcales bacterium]|nr:IS5 family transposase [Myxococcales bacterium]